MFNLACPGRQCVRNDVLSGLNVALTLAPEVEVNLKEDPVYHVADDKLA